MGACCRKYLQQLHLKLNENFDITRNMFVEKFKLVLIIPQFKISLYYMQKSSDMSIVKKY